MIDVDVGTGATTVVKQTPTPNVDLEHYVAERLWATAADGTEVPVDLVRHVGTPLDGTAPCCVYGYGSYEISMPPWFSVARLSLLDRGVVWALVHPRGGGELGRQWYLDGKLLNKRNTFTDTLAACEHLVTAERADRERIAIRGGSAGGLVMALVTDGIPSVWLWFGWAVLANSLTTVMTPLSTALALAVTFPEAGNLGGGGFAVVRFGEEVATLDFREVAPAAAVTAAAPSWWCIPSGAACTPAFRTRASTRSIRLPG